MTDWSKRLAGRSLLGLSGSLTSFPSPMPRRPPIVLNPDEYRPQNEPFYHVHPGPYWELPFFAPYGCHVVSGWIANEGHTHFYRTLVRTLQRPPPIDWRECDNLTLKP